MAEQRALHLPRSRGMKTAASAAPATPRLTPQKSSNVRYSARMAETTATSPCSPSETGRFGPTAPSAAGAPPPAAVRTTCRDTARLPCMNLAESRITFPFPWGDEDRAFSTPMPSAHRPLLEVFHRGKEKLTADFPFQRRVGGSSSFSKLGSRPLLFTACGFLRLLNGEKSWVG